MSKPLTIAATDTVCRADDVLGAVLDRHCILLDVTLGKYLELNPIAAEIWSAIETPVSVAALCRLFYLRFEAAPLQIEADVLAFLEKLDARSLLKRVGP